MYWLSESGELCQKNKVCCAKDDIKAPEPPGPKTPPPPGNATNCFLIIYVQSQLNCLIIISKLSLTICNFSSWSRRGDQPCSTKRKMAKHVWNILRARYDIWIPRWCISNNPWDFDYSRPLGHVSIDHARQLPIYLQFIGYFINVESYITWYNEFSGATDFFLIFFVSDVAAWISKLWMMIRYAKNLNNFTMEVITEST